MPKPTPTMLQRRHEYDGNGNSYDHHDRTHDDPNKTERPHTSTTTTNENGRTIIVTTVIIASGPDPNKVYHDMGSGAKQQQQGTPIDDPNKSSEDSSLEEQLREDQAALRRMVTILSLVGGLGVVAIVATIVIFARMRIRKRKQAERDLEDLHAEEDADDHNDDNDTHEDATTNCASPRSIHEMTDHSTAQPQESGMAHGLRSMPIPSAPPAPTLSSVRSQLAVYEGPSQRRHIISMTSQTTPAPSAPTAKELDALEPEDELCNHLSVHGYAIGSGSNDPLPKTQCPHCDHSPIPDAPPPAYTPSAPPLYAIPIENVVLDSSLSSSSTSSSHLLPQRRHSQS
ncbi:hypothetical protein EC973_001283 [Apophysomyces ossiformis]|uniref:Uncharacterized protein n=1 Tax=Apophysomyces ossiformis TaxID=679940 RepID=A0A8H7BQF6_9FUNG|nr:hypothetical protein EC973_001283 [Apophysomyces ossiformis]